MSAASKKARKRKIANAGRDAMWRLVEELQEELQKSPSHNDPFGFRSTSIRLGELFYECAIAAVPDVTERELTESRIGRSGLTFPGVVAARILPHPECRQEILAEISAELAEANIELQVVSPAGRG